MARMPVQAGRHRLCAAATDLYQDLDATHLLGRLLQHSRGLLDGLAGSISVVGEGRHSYAKIAERGVSCRLGQTFPLDEGVTGRVVARRRPVVLARYDAVATGHLPAAHPASTGAVAAVPIWWRGDVVGANIVFAGPGRCFGSDEIDELDVLTQAAAAALVTNEPCLAHLRHPVSAPTPLTPREQETLRALARGLGDHEISGEMGISRSTVEKHVGAVLRKSGTASRTAAVVHAMNRGWLPPR